MLSPVHPLPQLHQFLLQRGWLVLPVPPGLLELAALPEYRDLLGRRAIKVIPARKEMPARLVPQVLPVLMAPMAPMAPMALLEGPVLPELPVLPALPALPGPPEKLPPVVA
jgi:hypothetical protein